MMKCETDPLPNHCTEADAGCNLQENEARSRTTCCFTLG